MKPVLRLQDLLIHEHVTYPLRTCRTGEVSPGGSGVSLSVVFGGLGERTRTCFEGAGEDSEGSLESPHLHPPYKPEGLSKKELM